jgi:hypothetical protein
VQTTLVSSQPLLNVWGKGYFYFLFVQELTQTGLLQLTLQMETVYLNFSTHVFFYFDAKRPAQRKSLTVLHTLFTKSKN